MSVFFFNFILKLELAIVSFLYLKAVNILIPLIQRIPLTSLFVIRPIYFHVFPLGMF